MDAPSFIGASAATQLLNSELELAAQCDAKVLITGPSGVGKELVARLLHVRSRRHARPFVPLNCAAMPDSLLESELFGHERGSFTDAFRDKKGLLEAANGGTALLDEVGEMSLRMQALLLRFLENGEIQRVGSERGSFVSDVRVIAATNRKLSDRITTGEFREDLFYRLNVVAIHLPPLRERREDIVPLARHFCDRLGRRLGRPLALSAEALAWLEQEPWRGNVRELENAIERAAVLSNKEILEPDDFRKEPLPSPHSPGEKGEGRGTLREAVEAAERQAIAGALEAARGNRREAAKHLGVSLRTLFYKMERHGLG